EGIHQRAYALLNDTLGLPYSEYHAFLEYKAMTDKIDFMMDSDPTTRRGLGLCLAKKVFNEGVALFASFAMLLNFQRFGKMKG
ncbi:ribonucleotide-diphosphate reductase subunit beta, partial [Francisella tularensis subsp. holarctica]|uniref:ribonucleotide-diphosphate reductase subunit beta n=1 Tax=Francisella tularensis TaxID=263 RepID=UPI002381ABA2